MSAELEPVLANEEIESDLKRQLRRLSQLTYMRPGDWVLEGRRKTAFQENSPTYQPEQALLPADLKKKWCSGEAEKKD